MAKTCKTSSVHEQQHKKQMSEKKHNTHDDLQHLGFNAGEGGVKITEELIKELEEQVKNDYWELFRY